MTALVFGLASPAPALAKVPGAGGPNNPATTPQTPTTAQMPPLPPEANGTSSLAELPAPQRKATQISAKATDMPALHGSDPFCTTGMTAQQQANCRLSGSVAAPYPMSAYGIDYANPPTGLGQLSPGDWFATVMGWITSVVWSVWLYLIQGVLLLLNWAFTLKLVHMAMGDVKQGLGIMHDYVFGVSWLEAAIAVLGLWALWNGLVRRKTIETVAGLVSTVALMVGALLLIAQPDATVGRLSSYADQASLTALSGTSRANVAQPAQGFADAEGNLFTAFVLRPWCALEFGDVNYCTAPRGGTTVADIWLAFGAMGPGRQGLYNLATTGSITQYGGIFGSIGKALGLVSSPPVITQDQACSGSPNGQQCAALKAAQALSCFHQRAGPTCAFSSGQAGKVAMQAGGNPLTRLVLLIMISVGLLGAILLLLYLAVHLVFAAIMTLILLLGTPVMLLVSAFGESGRATTVAFGKRLLGAIITKLVFAVLLALVVLMAIVINNLKLGWFSVWLLNMVLWWGALIKRKQLIGFLTLDKRAGDAGLAVGGDGTQSPFRLYNLYAGYRLLQAGGHMLRGATRPVRAARRHAHERRTAQSTALRDEYSDEFEGRMRSATEIDRNQRASAARGVVTEQDQRRRDLAGMRKEADGHNRRLPQISRELNKGNLKPAYRMGLELERDQRMARLPVLGTAIPSAEAAIANAEPDTIAARSTLGQMGRGVDDRDVQRTISQRRRDLQQPFPTDDTSEGFDRHLSAAGIDPREYRIADADARQNYTRRAQQARDRDRVLLSRLDDPRAREGLPDTRAENREGWRETAIRGRVGRARLRSAEELQSIRDGRRHAGRVRSRRGMRG